MNERKIEYDRIDGGPIEGQQVEGCTDLLHKYLHEFISKDALKKDVEYCFRKGRVVAAYNDDELVGVVVGVHTPFFEKFHIGHIAVEKEFQGMGIGRELTEKVIPEDEDSSVHLNMDNPGVEKFYEKLGFKQTHKRFKRTSKKGTEVKPSD